MTTSTLRDREKVLIDALVAMDIAPVMRPNRSSTLNKPYLVPEYAVVSSTNVGIAPGGKVHKALFVVKVVTDLNVFSAEAQQLAQQLIDGFQMGTVYDCGGDKMRVTGEPTASTAMKTDTSWCLPVTIPVMVTGK